MLSREKKFLVEAFPLFLEAVDTALEARRHRERSSEIFAETIRVRHDVRKQIFLLEQAGNDLEAKARAAWFELEALLFGDDEGEDDDE